MIINVLVAVLHIGIAFWLARLAQKHYEKGFHTRAYVELVVLIFNVLLALLRFIIIVSA